jgi:hypothetical protein
MSSVSSALTAGTRRDDFNGWDVVRVYEPVRCEHAVDEFAALPSV